MYVPMGNDAEKEGPTFDAAFSVVPISPFGASLPPPLTLRLGRQHLPIPVGGLRPCRGAPFPVAMFEGEKGGS